VILINAAAANQSWARSFISPSPLATADERRDQAPQSGHLGAPAPVAFAIPNGIRLFDYSEFAKTLHERVREAAAAVVATENSIRAGAST
jgi:hypothetical protein